jgi:NTE family protein
MPGLSLASPPAGDIASPVPQKRRPKLGLVIGSGGIKCAAAIGLWRVLEREGIDVDVAVGCSGGSMYAAGIALGQTADFATGVSTALWGRVVTGLRYRALLQIALPRMFGFSDRVGLLDDRQIMRNLVEIFGDARFEDTRIPLFMTASDLRSMESVVLRTGPIVDCIRASIALPVLLRPWMVNGRLLIDGGTSNPLPVDVAIREGCEVILAMGFESASNEALSSISSVVLQATSLTINHLLRSTFAFYSAVHHAEIIPIMPTFDRPIKLTDAHQLPYIIEQGERAAEAELPYLRSLLAG